MTNQGRWVVWVTLLALGGCVSSSVQRGAVIGAASGAIAGAGLGAAISDKDVLGNTASKRAGNIALDPASSISAGVVIGAVFGGIVGAMVGHASVSHEQPKTDAQAELTQPEARPQAF